MYPTLYIYHERNKLKIAITMTTIKSVAYLFKLNSIQYNLVVAQVNYMYNNSKQPPQSSY